jgi:hypothetical protein
VCTSKYSELLQYTKNREILPEDFKDIGEGLGKKDEDGWE